MLFILQVSILSEQSAFSSKSRDRFFGPMQYFLYTPYSRESKNITLITAFYSHPIRLNTSLGTVT